MKNQNIVLIAIVFALAFALAPITNAAPAPTGDPEDMQLPEVSIHSAGNVLRGQTAKFVLEMNSAALFGGMYVNFKVGGTAVAGVDYVASSDTSLSAYIGRTGYGVISFKTLRDPRGSANHQAYSIVVKLEPGLGYALGESKSATIWIKDGPAQSDW